MDLGKYLDCSLEGMLQQALLLCRLILTSVCIQKSPRCSWVLSATSEVDEVYSAAFCLGCDGAMVGTTMRRSSSSQEPRLWAVLRCRGKAGIRAAGGVPPGWMEDASPVRGIHPSCIRLAMPPSKPYLGCDPASCFLKERWFPSVMLPTGHLSWVLR